MTVHIMVYVKTESAIAILTFQVMTVHSHLVLTVAQEMENALEENAYAMPDLAEKTVEKNYVIVTEEVNA